MLKKIFKKRINEIHGKFKDKKILIFDDISNFFGQESLGKWKIRGNGVLILTEEVFFFGMWKPKKELSINIKAILEISNPKSHMQKAIMKPLLKITFRNKNEEMDTAAWYVRHLDKWNEILYKLIN